MSASPELPFQLQVDAKHYLKEYDTLERFISYWYQINLVVEQEPEGILEIGVGNGFVTNYLRRIGIDVTSCDIDPNLKPDVVGSVLALPFEDRHFEWSMACQVLEHLPFTDFPKALKELARVSRKGVILSLPDSSSTLAITMRAFGRRKEKLVDLSAIRPKGPMPSHDQHFWEIGYQGTTLANVVETIEKLGVSIRKAERPVLNPYHHFFVLNKR